MIFDANTWVGHWPFRALPHTRVRDLLKQMDAAGIDRALVGSLHGLFYKDAHEANRELARDVKRHRDRLTPCAVLNPTYHGWRDDLRQCRDEFGMPVVRLTPDYHGYALTDAPAREIAEAAHDLKMRVALYGRIVDQRGRHRIDPGRGGGNGAVADFTAQFPRHTFLLLNFYRPVAAEPENGPKRYYDLTRFVGGAGMRMKEVIREIGAHRCVYGTTLLMRYPTPVRLALDLCDLGKRDRERIEHRNLEAILPRL